MLIETFVKSLKAFLHNESSDAVSRFALWVAPCVHYHLGGMVVLMFFEEKNLNICITDYSVAILSECRHFYAPLLLVWSSDLPDHSQGH